MKLEDIELNEYLMDAVYENKKLLELIEKIEYQGFELDITYLDYRHDKPGLIEDNYYYRCDNNCIKEIDLIIIYNDLSDAYQKKIEVESYKLEVKGIDY